MGRGNLLNRRTKFKSDHFLVKLKLAQTESELMQILTLQDQNHLSKLSEAEKKTQGFVTLQHSLDELKAMQSQIGQVIAVDNGKVVGYALAMTRAQEGLIPLLDPLYEALKTVEFNGKPLDEHNYYVMGQVCVAQAYRGKGLFRQLYQKHKAVFSSYYDLCLTEVSSHNPRSLRAHENFGFKTLATFHDPWDDWNVLGLTLSV